MKYKYNDAKCKRKCIPGLLCIENVTLFVLLGIFFLILFLYNHFIINTNKTNASVSKILVIPTQPNVVTLGGISSHNLSNDIFNDPYMPPLKRDDYFLEPTLTGDIRGLPSLVPLTDPTPKKMGLPINIETRGISSDYTQVGILTKTDDSEPKIILPLMGRRIMSGRDKWQYYTISNTGSLHTKLPIKIGRYNCTSEYGCDNIMDGDVVFVEGYKEKFRVTIYENNTYNYIPVL